MAYDELLAVRMRAALGPLPNLVEKKMFGGVGFLINGNMACGVHKNNMIVRVGPAKYKEALARPHTRPFDMTGRPMSG
jgi:TfoX/Sxy family transcriptional regulator of competence genes